MKIVLRIASVSQILYVPDGFIENIHNTQEDFFDWLDEQPENWVESPKGRLALRYTFDDFLRFVNEAVLENCSERAYFVTDKETAVKGMPVLKF